MLFSAGIGRTGCFIAISIAIQQLMRERAVDILAIVANLRLDRSPIASLSVFLAYFLFRRSAADHRALRGPCVKARSQLRMN